MVSTRERTFHHVPDGGWGWMVVLGAAITNMVGQALVSVFGLVFGEELKRMGHETIGAAWIMNIHSMVSNFSGLITGPVLKKFSNRQVAIVGGLMTATGMIFCSLATTLPEIVVYFGVLVGLGLGLIQPAAFVALRSYFNESLGQAVGLAMTGTAIGQMLMPQLVWILLDLYGYRGTTLLLGALCFNTVTGALLFQPVKRHIRKPPPSNALLLKETSNDAKPDANQAMDNGNDKVVIVQKRRSIWKRIATIFDLELLTDPIFIHIIFGISLVYTCNIGFGMIYPFFLQQSVGLSRGNTAMCMSLLSGADTVGRLTIPTFAKWFHIPSRATFIFGAALLVFARSLLAVQSSLPAIIIISIMCGYGRSATVLNQNLSVSEHCSERILPSALGLNMVGRGIMVLSLGQFFGWIRDYFQSFTLFIHAQSAVLALVVLTWGTELVVRRLRRKVADAV